MKPMQKTLTFSVSVLMILFSIEKNSSLGKHENLQITKYAMEDTAYHIDANFAAKGFGFDPTVLSLKKKYAGKLKETKAATANAYDHKIMDTIITLSGQGMKFVFYKGKNISSLTEATITSLLFILQKGIKIGLTKSQVMKKFPEMAMAMVGAGLWQIGNEERTQYFELNFKNNVVKTIKYFNPVD